MPPMHARRALSLLGVAASLASLIPCAAPAHAATIRGHVATIQGQPVAGAMVTLWNDQKNRKETVYSDSKGEYTLETAFTGKLALRARTYNHQDFNVEIELKADDVQAHNLVLAALTDPREISDALTASAHAATLPFPDPKIRNTFIAQCSYCHQQGNSLTRRPRSEDEWNDVIWRMEGYGSFLTFGEHNRIRSLYVQGFTGKPVVAVQTGPYSPEMARARIEEWHAGDALSFIHDTVVGRDDKLYGIDEGKDVIFILDRATAEIETVKLPMEADDHIGGRLRGAQLPIGVYTGAHGPHSAVQLKDGRLFITAALSGKLIEFDPRTRAFRFHKIPEGFLWRKGIYPHTIRLDKDENIWFTVTVSNRLARFDPRTGTFTDIGLPHGGFMRWITDTFAGVILKVAAWFPERNLQLWLSHHKLLNGGAEVNNFPYGIDVSPTTDEVWYAKLLGNRIGVIDRDTLETTEYPTPLSGPRRMRFGPDGILWIPSFDDGKLMRFDPATRQFEIIDLPVLSPGEYEMPYALAVHPRTGELWIAANNTDRVLRYLPREKRFIAYPMPNRVIWFRDFDFTRDGKVCASNSNLPAHAHEDGVPAFVCIEPEPHGAYGGS
jgi:streptogramin lyase